jgi:hypothetical protein
MKGRLSIILWEVLEEVYVLVSHNAKYSSGYKLCVEFFKRPTFQVDTPPIIRDIRDDDGWIFHSKGWTFQNSTHSLDP